MLPEVIEKLPHFVVNQEIPDGPERSFETYDALGPASASRLAANRGGDRGDIRRLGGLAA
jgi:hypothetical protein